MPMRTPRTRALEIGTDPSGFDSDVKHCPQCGHPLLPNLPHSHYDEQAENVGGEGMPVNPTTPFKLG